MLLSFELKYQFGNGNGVVKILFKKEAKEGSNGYHAGFPVKNNCLRSRVEKERGEFKRLTASRANNYSPRSLTSHNMMPKEKMSTFSS